MQGWATQLASDVDRDGLALELISASGEIAAEVFRCDRDHSVTTSTFVRSVPPSVLHWFLEQAEQRLGAFEDGVPLPPHALWTRAAG